MKGQIHAKIKLVIITITFLLIGYAWIMKNIKVAVIGALLYLVQMLFHIVDLVVKSKELKNGVDVETSKNFILNFLKNG